MAFQKQGDERIGDLVAALLAEQARWNQAGSGETIDDIEATMIRIGNQVALEVAAQMLARHTEDAPERCSCPDCNHDAPRVGEEERILVTQRGSVTIREAKYRCPKCRRHFFPSVGSDRDRSQL